MLADEILIQKKIKIYAIFKGLKINYNNFCYTQFSLNLSKDKIARDVLKTGLVILSFRTGA